MAYFASEGNGTRTVIDVVARPKRAIDIMEKKKQATGSTMNPTQQRRRAVRKRSEFGWMERAGDRINL